MATTTIERHAASAAGIERLMRPASVAIIGMSSKPGTPSSSVLQNLLTNDYQGEIHLVGRSGGTIAGIECVTSIDQLPQGIDLAIMIIPGEAVLQTVDECIERDVKSAVCFSSGFAETGDAGRREQEEIGRRAEAGGLGLIGPNCVGYFNYVDGFAAMLVPSPKLDKLQPDAGPAVAIVAQSGGIGHHLANTLQERGVPVSYMMTTGNEAHLGLSDIVAFLLDDPSTGAIICYAEQIRRPRDMLAIAGLARQKGKHILLLHPGKSPKARSATASHTGAMTGDYQVMRTIVEASGVMVLDTLEELLDVAEILVRYPATSGSGLGIVTTSGALCGIAEDYCGELGFDIPPMSPAQVESLAAHLPSFTPPRNPLDLGTLPAWQPELMERGIRVMLDDPAIGIVMVSNPYVGPPISTAWAAAVSNLPSIKPLIYVVHSEGIPLPVEADRILRENKIVVMRSPERAMRAAAAVARYAARQDGSTERPPAEPFADLPDLGSGIQTEWAGKQLLTKIGIDCPSGGLAQSLEQATAIASRIGYPVVIKAQSVDLAHKSDAGAVLLGIADQDALTQQWARLHDNVAKAKPGLRLDGVLVEKMAGAGTELVVGARRDPQWGPVLLVGMGGVWVEALGDVRLMAAGVSEQRIASEIGKLKAAKLLRGYRGQPPADIAAAAAAAARIGRLIVTVEEISEIDVNPLVVYPEGEGVLALDALIVTR